MFRRLLWHLLRGNKVRLAVALVALISGGAVISALMNLDLDLTRKLAREFRSLGANLVISAPRTVAAAPGMPGLMDESALERMASAGVADSVSAPYLYLVARAGAAPGQNVVVAGTRLDRLARLDPSWKISGGSGMAPGDSQDCLVGRNASRSLGVAAGSAVQLRYGPRSLTLHVAGVIDSGGSEDNQIFVHLAVAQQLAALAGKIQLIQISVPGSADEIRSAQSKLQSVLPGLVVRPIRQVSQAEGQLLARIRFLIFSTGFLILVLTALCVLATMAALAMERKKDVGLMKALGGSIERVVRIFLAEVGVLGTIGGVLGYALGMVLSVWMGYRVFGASIAPHWELLPITVLLMFFVALAGALPLRLLGNVRPAVILRGE